ncbi:MAG: hypothetical protein ACRDSK_10055 [Actinophytocola sp.]|uniref:5'-methylthioadenosine/S-adenosylhomocysteine nucleosidase family protein n=1 Tax=Actinophytocola sp. TaxID=1872138 RepID=UPI003D6B434A
MTTPTFAECRTAARVVRAAELGRQALGVARPRSVLGIVRDRGPLAVVLYIAAREGRLIWHNVNGFAVLEPRTPARGRLLAGGARLSLLRVVDRHWARLVYILPAATMLLAAVALALLTPLVTVALLLIVLSLLHVTVLMVAQLLWSGQWLHRLGAKERRVAAIAAESLPGRHWHVSLCHQSEPKRAEELLRLAPTRLVQLVTARINADAVEHGGRPVGVRVNEVLVWLTGGVTTTPMREAIENAAGVLRPYGPNAEVVIMTLPDSSTGPPKRPVDRGGFLFLYLVALALAVAFNAMLVAGWEGVAYLDALRWLGGRLFFTDLPGFTPVTTSSWVMGLLLGAAGVMTVPVAYFAIRQARKAQEQEQEAFRRGVEEPLSQPKILILVVTENERSAVIKAVREANGEPARISSRGMNSVFELGSLGGATVLLAQSSSQGASGPTGMMLTAEDLVRTCEPDYVILTGTCYGLWDDEQELGDICVPQQIQDLDPRTVTDKGVLLQGEVVSPSPTLLNRFTTATHDRAESAPKVHPGRMLASNTGFRSPELRQRIREENPYASCGEKESAAVYAAAARWKTDWVVVKGISDWGMDMTWSIDDQSTAARNAADFVVHTIQSGHLQEAPEPDRRRTTS